MQTTESGLIVPDAAIQKKQRTLAPGTIRRLRHFMQAMAAEGLVSLLACKECNHSVKLEAVGQLEPKVPGGGTAVTVTCQCSVRTEVRR